MKKQTSMVTHVERKKGRTVYTEDLGGYIRKRTVLHNPCSQRLPKPYKTNLKWSNRSIAFRKKHGLATTAKELQERKKNSPSGPEDFVIGAYSGRPRIEKEYFAKFGVFKSWEDITFSVDTTGKLIVLA